MQESTQSNSILMELALLVVDKINQSKYGILGAKDWFKSMMLIVHSVMKLISIQMEDTYFQVVMTLHWKSGILDKDIFYTPCMVMKAHQPQLHFRHVVIISQLVEVILLSWFGKVILMKTNKNLLKILELKLVKILAKTLVVCLQ